MRITLTCLGLLSCLALQAVAANTSPDSYNWPQWRGPEANGVVPSGNPPVEWSETKNVRWKAAVPGRGTSTPIVWGNQLYLLSAQPVGDAASQPQATPSPTPAETPNQQPPRRPGGGGGGFGSEKPSQIYQFLVICVDRQTGKVVWQKTACEEVPHEGHHRDHGFASASPVTDGTSLYVWFGSRGLYCYDLLGNLQWKKRFGQLRTRNSFGEGSSPALSGNTLILLWDHEGEDFIVALDKRTGEELWRQKRDEPTGWTTPFILKNNGRTEVMVSATEKIRSYDLENGKQLWECAGMTANSIPSPVADENRVYFISGYRGSSAMAIKLGQSGDLTGTDSIVWAYKKNTPYVPSPLLYEGNLYFFAANNASITCLDAKTGTPHYEAQKLEDISGVYASPVGVAGRVYAPGRDGKTAVLKSGAKLEVLATNILDDKIDASPVVIGDELYLRGHRSLYCISRSKATE